MKQLLMLSALAAGLGSMIYMNEAGEGGEGAAPAPTAADTKAAEKAAKAAEKQAEKERKAQEKADAKAAKAAEAEAKKAEKSKARVSQNGVTRPLTGVTKQVWDLADAISAENRRPAERKEVTERGLKLNIQQGTIHTQYGRWRKFHGLKAVREDKSAAASTAAPEAQDAQTAA